MFENLLKRSIKPTVNQIHEQLKKFFADVEETFIKLRYLFESVSKQEQATNPTDYTKCHGFLDLINEICRLRIQKEKAAKYPNLVEKSRSRCKV